MLIVTDFSTLTKELGKISLPNVSGRIIAYYTDTDNIPMSIYKKLNEMEDAIDLLPMAEINNPKNMVFAALVEAVATSEHEICVVADVKPSIYEFTVKSDSYKIHIRNDFEVQTSQVSKPQLPPSDSGNKIPKDNKSENAVNQKKGTAKNTVDTGTKEDVKALPFFNEFMNNITISAIPQDVTKDRYAEVLMTAMRNNPNDKSIIDYLKNNLNSVGIDNSIEILRMSGKFDRLKDIARS